MKHRARGSRLPVLRGRSASQAQVLAAAALRVHQLLVQLAGLRPEVRYLVVGVARERRRSLAQPHACSSTASLSVREQTLVIQQLGWQAWLELDLLRDRRVSLRCCRVPICLKINIVK